MDKFRKYIRREVFEMRPYVPGENLSNVCIYHLDIPESGGMIARNLKNHKDQWYMSKNFFENVFVLTEK